MVAYVSRYRDLQPDIMEVSIGFLPLELGELHKRKGGKIVGESKGVAVNRRTFPSE